MAYSYRWQPPNDKVDYERMALLEKGVREAAEAADFSVGPIEIQASGSTAPIIVFHFTQRPGPPQAMVAEPPIWAPLAEEPPGILKSSDDKAGESWRDNL